MAAATAGQSEELSFSDATALLFDPVPANRSATRTALTTIGFRNVIAISEVRELDKFWKDRPFDLLVADITQDASAVCDLVRAIRDGTVGANPFAHIVLMAWKLEHDNVQRALTCGADDLITRPFSIDFLSARVKVHTEARKPFVVTSEYVGPDRRKTPPRDAVNLINVPNMLLAKARDFFAGTAGAAEEIRNTKAKVDAERARKGAFKIACQLRSLRDAISASQPHSAELDALDATAKDMAGRSVSADDNRIHDVASALVEEIGKARAGDAAVHLSQMDLMARTLLETLYPSHSREELLQEVAKTVAGLKARERKRQKIA
ncbi:MAG: response regulator [Alphaproteobacteria bacterium]|nr:response regulator [Alphaproteobacteria bacterium]